MAQLLSGRKYYVIGGNYAISRIFRDKGGEYVDSIAAADIVIWTGGEDVSPEFYNERKHPKTGNNLRRDKWEKACYQQAARDRKICIGICRGGQFLNVMNGGTLWQHVDNHARGGEHPMLFETKLSPNQTLQRIVHVNSTHHQMMVPNSRALVEVWGRAGESTRKESGNLLKGQEKLFVIEPVKGHMTDCEIAYYPQTKSLCFQPHPEYSSKSTTDVFWTCVERVLAA